MAYPYGYYPQGNPYDFQPRIWPNYGNEYHYPSFAPYSAYYDCCPNYGPYEDYDFDHHEDQARTPYDAHMRRDYEPFGAGHPFKLGINSLQGQNLPYQGMGLHPYGLQEQLKPPGPPYIQIDPDAFELDRLNAKAYHYITSSKRAAGIYAREGAHPIYDNMADWALKSYYKGEIAGLLPKIYPRVVRLFSEWHPGEDIANAFKVSVKLRRSRLTKNMKFMGTVSWQEENKRFTFDKTSFLTAGDWADNKANALLSLLHWCDMLANDLESGKIKTGMSTVKGPGGCVARNPKFFRNKRQ